MSRASNLKGKMCFLCQHVSTIYMVNIQCHCIYIYIHGGFLKWWYPTTRVFLLNFRVFWGYHRLRKHPYIYIAMNMVISGDIRILSLATTILCPSHSSNKLTQTCLAPQNVTVRVGDTPPCHPCVLREIRESNGREAQQQKTSVDFLRKGLGDMNFQQIGETIDPNCEHDELMNMSQRS